MFIHALPAIAALLSCQGTDDVRLDSGISTSGTAGSAPGVLGHAVLPDPRVTLGPVQTCAEPLDGVAYQEVGEALGLRGNANAADAYGDGAGAAIDDVDSDGDLDILLAFDPDTLMLYRWTGAAFEGEVILPDFGRPQTLNLADVDSDGDLDILLGRAAMPVLALNDGTGHYDSAPLPAHDGAQRVKELAPADVDGDGDVDLYAMTIRDSHDSSIRQDAFYLGNGDGTFELADDFLPVEATGQGFDAGWFDWQGDGDLDLYVANDAGSRWGPDFLLENQGGTLVAANDSCDCGMTHAGMNVDAADFNRDGVADLVITDFFTNVLLQGLADGTFVDVGQSVGFTPVLPDGSNTFPTGWGAVFLDHDNDGELDVLMALGSYTSGYSDGVDGARDTGAAEESSRLPLPISLLAQRDGLFADLGPDLGLDGAGSFRATVAQDFNSDGVLDLLVTSLVEPPRLYLSQGCTAAGWLHVDAPTGSRIQVTAGDQTWTDWATTESGYAAAQPSSVHFGLGDAIEVTALEVTLPGGDHVTWSRPFGVNRSILVTAR